TADDVAVERALAQVAAHVGTLVLDRVDRPVAPEERDPRPLRGDDQALAFLDVLGTCHPDEFRHRHRSSASRTARRTAAQMKTGAPFPERRLSLPVDRRRGLVTPAPAAAATAPAAASSVAKDEPQPHDFTAFGLLILKPPPWSESSKSIDAPVRYWWLFTSTMTFTPPDSKTRSSEVAGSSAICIPYESPEQPPPATNTRMPSNVPPFCSMMVRISLAAFSLRLIILLPSSR